MMFGFCLYNSYLDISKLNENQIVANSENQFVVRCEEIPNWSVNGGEQTFY